MRDTVYTSRSCCAIEQYGAQLKHITSRGLEESDTTERLHFPFSFSWTGEGNGDPLQCSCLENPRDRGAWWAAVYGVAQSRTRLNRCSSSSSSRCWERLKSGEEREDRGWDGWMASLTRWTWVWVNSGSWWWTGRPGMLRFMGSQRVGHDWSDLAAAAALQVVQCWIAPN